MSTYKLELAYTHNRTTLLKYVHPISHKVFYVIPENGSSGGNERVLLNSTLIYSLTNDISSIDRYQPYIIQSIYNTGTIVVDGNKIRQLSNSERLDCVRKYLGYNEDEVYEAELKRDQFELDLSTR